MNIIEQLQAKGVVFPDPRSVYVAPDIDIAKIASGVVIHPGCRLSGKSLSIGSGSVIGLEAPATVNDCQLGEHTDLAGGFFDGSTFLNGFKAGSGAHVRPGCLFEEASSIAHCVGAKQTIFMPWATTGSLINLCDCLLAGGTGRTNHSEIGSSYIHFNFTPHQDKATASLLGDVPRGVLLNQPPIFLGGQGGLVGPSLIAYGTVIPAGQIWRGDVLDPCRLVAKNTLRGQINIAYDQGVYHSITRVLRNNFVYIGNLMALDLWYRVCRSRFMLHDPFQATCHAGARHCLAYILNERLTRLEELAVKVQHALTLGSTSSATADLQSFVAQWPRMRTALEARMAAANAIPVPEAVATCLAPMPRDNYLTAIQSLAPESARTITVWLEQYVRETLTDCQ